MVCRAGGRLCPLHVSSQTRRRRALWTLPEPAHNHRQHYQVTHRSSRHLVGSPALEPSRSWADKQRQHAYYPLFTNNPNCCGSNPGRTLSCGLTADPPLVGYSNLPRIALVRLGVVHRLACMAPWMRPRNHTSAPLFKAIQVSRFDANSPHGHKNQLLSVSPCCLAKQQRLSNGLGKQPR